MPAVDRVLNTEDNRLPFNGEEDNQPDGDEAERVRREQKAFAHSRSVHPTNAVSSRPQGQSSLEPVEQNVRQ